MATTQAHLYGRPAQHTRVQPNCYQCDCWDGCASVCTDVVPPRPPHVTRPDTPGGTAYGPQAGLPDVCTDADPFGQPNSPPDVCFAEPTSDDTGVAPAQRPAVRLAGGTRDDSDVAPVVLSSGDTDVGYPSRNPGVIRSSRRHRRGHSGGDRAATGRAENRGSLGICPCTRPAMTPWTRP